MKKVLLFIGSLCFIALLIFQFQNAEPFEPSAIPYASGQVQSKEGFLDEEAVTRTSPSEIVETALDQFDVNPDQVAVLYHHLQENEAYYLNEAWVVDAASTTKIAISMLFVDLMEDGELDWESELPYEEIDYEDGEGAVTNEEKKASYPVRELIYEMLVHSDNTATNVLTNYHIDYYSGSISGFREAIVTLSGMQTLPHQVYEGNFATAEMLGETLLLLTREKKYAPIKEIMTEAQQGERLKKYVSDGMAAKYGINEDWEHDIGVYYQDDEAVYLLVVLTEGVSEANELMGVINLRLNEQET